MAGYYQENQGRGDREYVEMREPICGFPTLSLEQVHSAIAFCLGHQEEAEAYLRAMEKKCDGLESAAKQSRAAAANR